MPTSSNKKGLKRIIRGLNNNRYLRRRPFPGEEGGRQIADRYSGPALFFCFTLFFFPRSANFYTDFLPIGRPDIHDNSGRRGLI